MNRKRRRVDLSLRLEEAKAAAAVLAHWLRDAGVVAEAEAQDRPAVTSRVRRVFQKLQQGIEYVVAVNPSHRPQGAKARTV